MESYELLLYDASLFVSVEFEVVEDEFEELAEELEAVEFELEVEFEEEEELDYVFPITVIAKV